MAKLYHGSTLLIEDFKDNITNCITEIPQDIKLELNDSTLTLKAGSKVYIPNGSNTFDVYTSTTDFESGDISGIDRDYLFFVNPSKTGLSGCAAMYCYSGTTEPATPSLGNFWYDTTNNSIKRWDGTSWVSGFSLPFCIISAGATNINQVFNGFGYIGSTIFALPGVKGLIPNGRNADGTLKNTTYTTTSVGVGTVSGTHNTHNICLIHNNTLGVAVEYQYNSDTNYVYNSSTLANYTNRFIIGTLSSTSGTITSFNPKPAFHALDYNDFSDLKDTVDTKANDSDVVKLTGDQTIAGTKVFTSNINSSYGVAYGSDSQIMGVQGFTSDNKLATLFQGWAESNTNATGMYCFNPSGQYAGITVRIDTNGNAEADGITPSTTDNSTKIATTAFVNNKFQVVSSLPASPTEGVFYFVKES